MQPCNMLERRLEASTRESSVLSSFVAFEQLHNAWTPVHVCVGLFRK